MLIDDINAPETEGDDQEIGLFRLARWRHQNAQLLGTKPRLGDKYKSGEPAASEGSDSSEE